MAHLVTFRSAKFDPKAEPTNPINPIAGHAVLVWLGESLRSAGYEVGRPDAEDWGWYAHVSTPEATYLVGASGEGELGDLNAIEWTIQIHRQRSFTDKLLGRNAHVPDDPLTSVVERIVRGEPSAEDVIIDRAG